MSRDVIYWHRMEKTDIPDDPYCRVPFNMDRATEISMQIFNGGTAAVQERLQKAVSTRGYHIVNIDWMRKELQLVQQKNT
jgi:hypothetical protein